MFNKTFQMEAPEGCPAQVYTIMKDVSFIYVYWFVIEIFPKEELITFFKLDLPSNVAQAWELEPEKRPTFAASRDSLDLFRTQNPQWRRRKTFPRTSKKWKWMPVSLLGDSRKVIETSDERGKSSFDSIMYEKNFTRPKNYFNCNNGRKDLVWRRD